MRIARCVLLASPVFASFANGYCQEVMKNPFHDPMLQITSGLPGCPVPQEPTYTREEFQHLAHERAQRGVSCWIAGRCRLPNGYLYDPEIIPRVKRAIDAYPVDH